MSTAMPTSQSAFFAPPKKICNSRTLVSIPRFTNASKNGFSSPVGVDTTYAIARMSFLPATPDLTISPKFTRALKRFRAL